MYFKNMKGRDLMIAVEYNVGKAVAIAYAQTRGDKDYISKLDLLADDIAMVGERPLNSIMRVTSAKARVKSRVRLKQLFNEFEIWEDEESICVGYYPGEDIFFNLIKGLYVDIETSKALQMNNEDDKFFASHQMAILEVLKKDDTRSSLEKRLAVLSEKVKDSDLKYDILANLVKRTKIVNGVGISASREVSELAEISAELPLLAPMYNDLYINLENYTVVHRWGRNIPDYLWREAEKKGAFLIVDTLERLVETLEEGRKEKESTLKTA